uniref:Transmembrane protein n=1 Tax=Panagrellus redivivus TaxID=6233 RepID=A0A7E4V460_PANRE
MIDFTQLSLSFVYISIGIAISRTKDRGIHHLLEIDAVKDLLGEDKMMKQLKSKMNQNLYYLHTTILIYGIVTTCTHFYMFGVTIKRWTTKSRNCCLVNFPETTMIFLSLTFTIPITFLARDLMDFPNDRIGFYDDHSNAYVYALHQLQQHNESLLHEVLTSFHGDNKCCGVYTPTEFLLNTKIKSKSHINKGRHLAFMLLPDWREKVEMKNAMQLPFAPSFCCTHAPPDEDENDITGFKPNATCTFEFFSPANHNKIISKPVGTKTVFNVGCLKKSSYGIVSLLFLTALICTLSLVVQIGSLFVRCIMKKTKSIRLQPDGGA